jgi:hypothetical protein
MIFSRRLVLPRKAHYSISGLCSPLNSDDVAPVQPKAPHVFNDFTVLYFASSRTSSSGRLGNLSEWSKLILVYGSLAK